MIIQEVIKDYLRGDISLDSAYDLIVNIATLANVGEKTYHALESSMKESEYMCKGHIKSEDKMKKCKLIYEDINYKFYHACKEAGLEYD